MKSYTYVLLLSIMGFFSQPLMAQENEGKSDKDGDMLIYIDGERASNKALNEIPAEEIKNMHYLSSREATDLYGAAAANGVLLVQTQEGWSSSPIVIKDGERIPADSLGKDFKRIDVIRGKQAMSLYGIAGKNGVLIVQQQEERINALVEVVDEKGRPIRGAALKNEIDDTIAVTNKCGMAYLEKLLADNRVSITHEKYQSKNIEVENKKVKIVLEK